MSTQPRPPHEGEPDLEYLATALEQVRTRLLDKTRRNRLLNFRESGRDIPIIDEMPDQVHEQLIVAGECFRFLAQPEPDEEAEEEEVETQELSRELPASAQPGQTVDDRYNDDLLQTPFRRKELDRRLRRLYSEHRTIVEETGANNLYLAVGFLHWRDEHEESVGQSAPLMMIPVRLERAGSAGAATYSLAFDDEALDTNYSLYEKLKHSFEITLPLLNDESTPEGYWAEVDRAIQSKKKSGWHIVREMTLGLFRFQKQVMWHDLDPDRWPNGSLTTKPLVQRVLLGPKAGDSAPGIRTEPYVQDDPEAPSASLRLVRDADSSQFSALVDALNCKDGLVIEGPPGTGKSQTITNLIAAALGEGKSVLFVAEKMAALEVVYRRLEESGLGDFCLQLHGLQTGKKELLDSIAKRMNHSVKRPSGLRKKRKLLEQARRALLDTSAALARTAGPEGLTIHDTVWRVERLRQVLPGSFTPIDISDASDLSFSEFSRLRQVAEDLGREWLGIPEHARVAWSGFTPSQVSDSEADELSTIASSFAAECRETEERLRNLPAGTCLVGAPSVSLLDLARHADDELLPALPPGFPEEVVRRICLEDKIAAFEKFVEAIERFMGKVTEINQTFNFGNESSEEWSRTLRKHGAGLAGIACDPDLRVGNLGQEASLFEEIIGELLALPEKAERIVRLVGGQLRTLADCESLAAKAGELGQGPQDLLLYANPAHLKSIASALLDDAKARCEDIQRQGKELAGFELERVESTEEVSAAVRAIQERREATLPGLSSEYRRAKRYIRSLMTNPKRFSRSSDFLESLDSLVAYGKARDEFAADERCVAVLGSLFAGIETDWERVSQLVQFSQGLRDSLGAQIAQELLSDWALHVDQMGEVKLDLERSTSRIREFASTHPFTDVLWQRPLEDIAGTLRAWLREVREAVEDLVQPWCNPDCTLQRGVDLAEVYAKAKDEQSRIEANSDLGFVLDACWERSDTRLNALQQVRDWIRDRLEFDAIDRAMLVSLFSESGVLDRERFGLLMDQLRSLSSSFEAHVRDLEKYGAVSRQAWLGGADAPLAGSASKLAKAVETASTLPVFVRWRVLCEKAAETGLGSIAEAVAAGDLEGTLCAQAFEFSVLSQVLSEQVSNEPLLLEFGRESYEGLRERFGELDRQMMELTAEEIAADLCKAQPDEGVAYGRAGDRTQASLLRHEAGKKRRHIPIRQLVARAADALQTLKPCFLMSPLSVAQFLPPGQIEFDLVVMDEASQIRPEDALGAMARGRRAVVVGDPKQLPPTQFFDTASAEDDEAEETILDDTESILDVCLKQFPFRRLRWHYRSEHEDLIRFSNDQFYDGDLIVFPSPHGKSREYGVHCNFNETPSYRRGRNREEARLVVENILNHFRRIPETSLGVVAFNKRQAEEIETLLEQARSEDPLVDECMTAANEREPFFVKNLENVQGDERDVIFISATYGPEGPGQRVFQRFGPMNSDVGWRRLNVIATRARQRVELFTSMRPTDIIAGDGARRGVRALRNYLEYAATGSVSSPGRKTGGAPESPFEEAVGHIVESLGYEIEPQVGVEGFFIDIGVCHPDRPGEYLLGLECDGASYHSARSVRDRDRLRQEILESKGWTIHRIWSTSWLQSRAAEIQRLKHAIESRLEQDRRHTRPVAVDTDVVVADTRELHHLGEKPEEAAAGLAVSISEALDRFWEQNIKPQFPNRENSVLSEPIVALISQRLPETREQWLGAIPLHLREKLDKRQAEFLDDILELVSEYA
ncbi:MAG: DUF4011 domain-containing protein [Myxococcota bacterium]